MNNKFIVKLHKTPQKEGNGFDFKIRFWVGLVYPAEMKGFDVKFAA